MNGENTSTISRGKYETYYEPYMVDIKNIKKELNIIPSDNRTIRTSMIDKFNRFKIAFPEEYLSKTFGHIFFTRPDLNLYGEDGTLLSGPDSDPTFSYLDRTDRALLKTLTSDSFTKKHDLNPFLSNKAESFETKDQVLKTKEYGETFTGYKVQYGTHTIDSDSAGEISILFTEDSNYSVYKIHKAWIDYISKVYRGELTASEYNIRNFILDYAASIYFFLCGPDGETILFWTKYTGVFPTNVPTSEASWQKGNTKGSDQVSISYSYAWKEDFNPAAIAEFNINARRSDEPSYVPTYDRDILSVGNTFMAKPWIELINNDNEYTYKLRYTNG